MMKVQVSDNMALWNSSADILIGAEDGTGPNGASYTVAENGSGPDTITLTVPSNSAMMKFVRLLITR